jgi:hypothetical protein
MVGNPEGILLKLSPWGESPLLNYGSDAALKAPLFHDGSH